MQRQLTRMERDVNKIVEHKELTESCCALKEEVTQFVKIFREELLTQDERGREMTDTYKKILVCYCIHPSIHPFIYLSIHLLFHPSIHPSFVYFCPFVQQEQFGEPPDTDSEDFFNHISVFIKHFRRVHKELFPPPKPSPKVPRKRYVLYSYFHPSISSFIYLSSYFINLFLIQIQK